MYRQPGNIEVGYSELVVDIEVALQMLDSEEANSVYGLPVHHGA